MLSMFLANEVLDVCHGSVSIQKLIQTEDTILLFKVMASKI